MSQLAKHRCGHNNNFFSGDVHVESGIIFRIYWYGLWGDFLKKILFLWLSQKIELTLVEVRPVLRMVLIK